MSGRLAGKAALITGAGSGIGAETARLFASEGASVAVNDVVAERAEKVASGIRSEGGQALAVPADVSNAVQVEEMFRAVETAFGRLNVLVNNAFFSGGDGTITELREEAWDRAIDVCLKGPFLCTRRAVPLMKAQGGGSIVSLSSVNALFGIAETAYTAAKGGLIAMMRLVAAEYGEWNIRSNIICPGTIGTEFCLNYWQKFPTGWAKLMEMYPLGRIGTPREVASYALFLASDESSFVTGSVQVIDGGLLAGRKLEIA